MVLSKSVFRIHVLMGGISPEREISLQSGQNVYEALLVADEMFDPKKKEIDREEDILPQVRGADLVFNCLHGGIGEDGTVQALLDLLNTPYTGTGPMGSALAMDKLISKKIFRRARVKTPSYLEVEGHSTSEVIDSTSERLGFPAVVKPVKEGSSRGVRLVYGKPQLRETLDALAEEYGRLYVEEYINGTEVTAGIIEQKGKVTALPLVELRVKWEKFYNYKAKYTPGETEFVVPAELPNDVCSSVKNSARRIHKEFGCKGFSRVDFIVEPDGSIFGLETNTLPGMTDTSDLPLAAEEAGISFPKLVEKMVSCSIDRGKTGG